MKIAVLGAGNTGCSLAADYSLRSHEVTLIKTSHSIHDDNFEYLASHGGEITLDEFGTLKTAHIARLSRSVADIASADVVLLCTRTDYHERVISAAAGHMRPGQLLLIVPGYMSTAYVLKYRPDCDIICAEAESAFIDGRIISPGRFKVGFRNVRNPIGVFPAAKREAAFELLNRLGTPFAPLSSVAEAALHNPNMIVHTVGAVMSIPRIEATGGDYCMYHEVFTPAVWKMLCALDAEKCALLSRLGLAATRYVDACHFRNSLDESADAEQVFFAYAAMPERAKGPTSVDSRYITEDVPQGLVLMEALASRCGVKTPVASAFIELASAALGRDLRAGGRSLERLGVEAVDRILSEGSAK